MNKEPKSNHIEKIFEPRQPFWKKEKILIPYCPVCKEILFGNNSKISPYQCSCGEWRADRVNPGFYKIKINK